MAAGAESNTPDRSEVDRKQERRTGEARDAARAEDERQSLRSFAGVDRAGQILLRGDLQRAVPDRAFVVFCVHLFHHVCFVFDAQTPRAEIFVNGELPIGFTTLAPSGPLREANGAHKEKPTVLPSVDATRSSAHRSPEPQPAAEEAPIETPEETAPAIEPTPATSADARTMATGNAGVQYLAYSTSLKLASAPVEETATIEPERQAAIDGFVDETAPAEDAGELTGDALSGSSELGELSTDEQRYLVDRSLDTWLPPQPSSGELETNYVAVGQLATRAAQDPALGAVVLPTYADRAVELAASAPPGIDGFDERRQAAALSTEAILNAPDEAAVRGLLEGLGPDGASHFVDALGLDSEDVLASTPASSFGGSPNVENRVVAADRLLSSLATGTPTESSQAAIAQAFLTFDKKALDPALVGELPQSLANAMGIHWCADDPAIAASEAARFGEMFNSEKGRDLFFAEGLDHPEWNQATLDAHDGNPSRCLCLPVLRLRRARM
jgi:hypothetical protein